MIFITVGTHEQSFNRLVKKMDELACKFPTQEIFMQTGYSTYIPKNVHYSAFLSPEEMNRKIENSEIIITHGGPASFMNVVGLGKVPIVVPRQKKFGEHVNDHQVTFSRAIEEKYNNIIVVEEINKLESILFNYESIVAKKNKKLNGHNLEFNRAFANEVDKLMGIKGKDK
jgi:UDP-N-acetylglucosamine transferase subunit ALG13